MIIMDLFDIDFHIFTVIKFLFNLVVRFKYININGLYSTFPIVRTGNSPTQETSDMRWI